MTSSSEKSDLAQCGPTLPADTGNDALLFRPVSRSRVNLADTPETLAEIPMEGAPKSVPQKEKPASLFATVVALCVNLVPVGGLLSTGFNLASTTIGAGILGLPDAFRSVGSLMAILYIATVTIETVFSMHLLVLVVQKTGLLSYEDMASKLLHAKAVYLVAGIRLLHSLGACIAYVVTIGNLLTPILTQVAQQSNNAAIEFFCTPTGTRLLQSLLWLIFFLPVSIPRRINSLRYVSLVGVVLIIFFCFCVVIHASMDGLQKTPRPATSLVKVGNGAIEGLGVFIFSFMCQINCIEVYREMTKCDPKRFLLCSSLSMALCGTLYIFTGLFGYLDFGESVKSSVLLMYEPLKEPQMLISYIGVFAKITASYGLLGYTFRGVVCDSLGWSLRTTPVWKHFLLVFSVCIVSLICGLFIPNVNMVFSFIGSFCGGFVAFLLPALFYMYSGGFSRKETGLVTYISTYLVLWAGVVAVVFGTGATIYSSISS